MGRALIETGIEPIRIMFPSQARALKPTKWAAIAWIANSGRSLLRQAEVDRAVLFGLLTRFWQMLTGPVTLLFIARYFKPEIQGFYYTFASLLALQAFVELGFYLVIINVSSHEWARLQLNIKGRIVGEPTALSRLVSLGRLTFKWYAVASAIFVVGVGGFGFLFFSQKHYSNIAWQAPWVVLVLLTGFVLWGLPFNSLLEGCGQVGTVNRFRLSQAILETVVLWTTLAAGGGLWAAAASAGVRFLRDLYLLLVQYRRFFEPFFLRLRPVREWIGKPRSGRCSGVWAWRGW